MRLHRLSRPGEEAGRSVVTGLCKRRGASPVSELGRAQWQLCRKGSAVSASTRRLGQVHRGSGLYATAPATLTQLPALGLQTVADGQVPKQKGRGDRRERILCLAWFGEHSPQCWRLCARNSTGSPNPGRGILGKWHHLNSGNSPPKKIKTTPRAVAGLRGDSPTCRWVMGEKQSQVRWPDLPSTPQCSCESPPSQRPGNEAAGVG